MKNFHLIWRRFWQNMSSKTIVVSKSFRFCTFSNFQSDHRKMTRGNLSNFQSEKWPGVIFLNYLVELYSLEFLFGRSQTQNEKIQKNKF